MSLCSRKWRHTCDSVCACMPVFLHTLAWLTNRLAMLMETGIAHSFPYAPHLGCCGAKLRADISQGLKRSVMGLDHAGRHLRGWLSCGGWTASLWDAPGCHFGRLELTTNSMRYNSSQYYSMWLNSSQHSLFWGMYGHVIRKLKKQKETQVDAKIERKFYVFPIKLQPLLFSVYLILFFHFTLSLKSPTIDSSLKNHKSSISTSLSLMLWSESSMIIGNSHCL